MRLELTSTGFAIRRLSRLATRASWNGRRDSNSRVEFGRLACFQLHHFRRLGRRLAVRPPAPSSWGENRFPPQTNTDLHGEEFWSAFICVSLWLQMKFRYAKKQMKAARTMSRTHFETHFSRGWRSHGLSQSTEIVIRLKAPAFISRKKGTSIVKKQRSGLLASQGSCPLLNNSRDFFVGIGSGSPLPLINACYTDDLSPLVRVFR